jgi:hypothetical protein
LDLDRFLDLDLVLVGPELGLDWWEYRLSGRLLMYSSLEGGEMGAIFVSAGMYGTGIGLTVPFKEYL